MKTLYNTNDALEIVTRLEKITSSSKNQWGKMNAAQMMAHINEAMETASGKKVIPPVFIIGRMIGSLMKKGVLTEKPWGKGSPTDKSYVFSPDVNFEEYKSKAVSSIKEFQAGGPAKCTTHPHPFFGQFTPEQWGVFQWKHLDHHLRQFGA